MAAPNIDQDGLRWGYKRSRLFGKDPLWTREPEMSAIESLVRQELHLNPDEVCNVSFMAEGALNKLYAIEAQGHQDCVLRVSLPVDPVHKTAREVATLRFLESKSSLPVPRVILYSTDRKDIGFEWILMTRLPGTSLRDKWRHTSLQAKNNIARRLAGYQAELFDLRFHGIGGLREEEAKAENVESVTDGLVERRFVVNRIGSVEFFYDDHIRRDVPRGPYVSSEEWLQARLDLFIGDQDRIIERGPNDQDTSDEDHKEERSDGKSMPNTDEHNVVLTPIISEQEKTHTSAYVKGQSNGEHCSGDLSEADDEDDDIDEEDVRDARWLKNLATILRNQVVWLAFSDVSESEPEPSMLYHQDLHEGNILIDASGEMTGIVDWECVSASPPWAACQKPKLLEGRSREECPDRDTYGDYNPDAWGGQGPDPKEKDSDGKGITYWEHLEEHEQTVMSKTFFEEMEQRCPSWTIMYRGSLMRRNLSDAIDLMEGRFRGPFEVDQWCRAVRRGCCDDDLEARLQADREDREVDHGPTMDEIEGSWEVWKDLRNAQDAVLARALQN